MPRSSSRTARRVAYLVAVCLTLALAREALAQEPIGKPLIHNFERADVVSELQHLGRRAGRARRHVLREQRRRARVRRSLMAADCAARGRRGRVGRDRGRRQRPGVCRGKWRLRPSRARRDWAVAIRLAAAAGSTQRPQLRPALRGGRHALRRCLFQRHEQGVLLRAGTPLSLQRGHALAHLRRQDVRSTFSRPISVSWSWSAT